MWFDARAEVYPVGLPLLAIPHHYGGDEAVDRLGVKKEKWSGMWSQGPDTHSPETELTGNFLDGFGNRVSIAAVANPGLEERKQAPSDLYDRMPGFGCVIFHKQSGLVTFECWPRGIDPTAKDAWQYAGWPLTVDPR